jgi:tRNA(fMet)-specific endonuclease VapC
MRRFVLDTNICIAFVRESSLYDRIDNELELSKEDAVIIISVVTKAELFSLGIQRNWGNKKFEKLNSLLDKLIIIDINSSNKDLIDSYSQIDAFSQGNLLSNPSGMSARNMGKNDLWIASTANVTKAALITTDADFDHLDNIFINVKKYKI